MKWDQIQLGEVIGVKHGYAFKSEFFSDSGEYVLLSPGNCLENGGFHFKGGREKYYIGGFPPEFLLNEGDVLVVMTDLINNAPILGGSFTVPESHRFLHNQRLGLIRITDERRIDKGFLYYLLNTHGYRAQVRGSASGATVRHTSPGRIKECKVRIPCDVGYQRKIGETLFAYDDLIENNRRRMALLEDAARQLFREWFVRLRFPGYEHTRIVDGVPEGWEKVAIESAFHTVLGGTPSRVRADFWDGGTVPWINSGKVNELRIIEPSELITEKALNSSAAKLMPRSTTVLAITGATLGQVSMLEIECAANQSVVGIIDPSGLRSEFVYLMMSYRIGDLVARATGGAQVHINKDIVNSFEVVLPSARLSALFKEHLDPMFRQIALFMFQNRSLRAARDLLLPRLMNGEVAV